MSTTSFSVCQGGVSLRLHENNHHISIASLCKEASSGLCFRNRNKLDLQFGGGPVLPPTHKLGNHITTLLHLICGISMCASTLHVFWVVLICSDCLDTLETFSLDLITEQSTSIWFYYRPGLDEDEVWRSMGFWQCHSSRLVKIRRNRIGSSQRSQIRSHSNFLKVYSSVTQP